MVQILFSGFYVTRAAIPMPLIWAYYISFFRYSLAILVRNLFHDLHFEPCDGTSFCFFGADGTGRDVERQYGVNNDSMAMLFGVCIGYTAIIVCIGYLALVLQLRSQLVRKTPHDHAGGSLAERVLDLPPYALESLLSARVPAASAEAPAAPRRRSLWRRSARTGAGRTQTPAGSSTQTTDA